MSDQLTNNPEALRLFFTEDIYLVDAVHTSAELLDITDSKQENNQAVVNVEMPSATLDDSPPANTDQAPVIPAIAVPVLMKPAIPTFEVPAKEEEPVKAEASAEPAETAHTKQVAAAHNFQYVGANQRNILILVNDAQHPVSTLQGRELLGNILKAIGLSRNDCALVNYASCNGANFSALKSFFKPQYVFAFGVSPDQLDIPTAPYNSIVSQEGSKLIFSSNLDVLSGDASTKKLLWGSLKQIQL